MKRLVSPKSLFVCSIATILFACGCGEGRISRKKQSFHLKYGWKAENYFDDPKVIELCRAIETSDLEEIERLVAQDGADINAKGYGKMTPLLWAMPDNKLPRFRKLLELGADPNVMITDDFNTGNRIYRPGTCVTLMASRTAFAGFFEAVFENGGDANIDVQHGPFRGDPPIFYVIREGRDKFKKLKILIKNGANLNHTNGSGTTPAIEACSHFGQYDVCFEILKAGADPKIFNFGNLRLIHILLFEKNRRSKVWTPKQRKDFEELIEYLKTEHGETLTEAQNDMTVWHSWPGEPIDKAERIKKVILERDARKAAEKKSEAANSK